MNIDFVYIIHIKCSEKRKVHMENVLKEQNIKNYKYIGFDGSDISKEELDNINSNRLKYYTNTDCKKLTRGQIGCIKSHHMVYQDMIVNNYNNVLIIEDDTKFKISFDEICQKLKTFPLGNNFDYILLHRKCQNLCNIAKSWGFVKTWFKTPNVDEPLGYNNEYVKCGTCFGTCSQIVSLEGAKKLNIWFSTILEPMDIQLHMCNSHNRKFKEICNNSIIDIYATKTSWIEPAGFPSLTQNIR